VYVSLPVFYYYLFLIIGYCFRGSSPTAKSLPLDTATADITSSFLTLISAINYVHNTLKILETGIRGPSPLGSILNDIPNLKNLLVSLPIDGDI